MKDLAKKIKEASIEASKVHKWQRDENIRVAFVNGALSPEAKEYWQKGMYTEEEVLNMLNLALGKSYDLKRIKEWFDANKKK